MAFPHSEDAWLRDIAGKHGTPFGSDPLVCAAAPATPQAIEDDGLLQRTAQRGEKARHASRTVPTRARGFVEGHRTGLVIGAELDRRCGDLVRPAPDAGLLISVTAEKAVRLLSPLIISADELRRFADILVPLIKRFLSAPATAVA